MSEKVRNTELGDSMFQLLSELSQSPIEDTDDIKEDADRMDRPGMLHQVAVLYMQGTPLRQIADQFSVRPAVIGNLVKRQSFKNILDQLSIEVVDACKIFMRTGAVRAVSVLVNSLESDDERIKLQAANSVLDRVGLKSTNQIEVKATINAMSQLDDATVMQYLIESQQKPAALPSYAEEVDENADTSGTQNRGVEETGV